MKYPIFKFICISLLLINCSKNESNIEPIPENIETEQNCLIEEIRFATSKYKYIYNNNNELHQIINTYNDNPTTYYVNKIANDSIEVGLIFADLSQDLPTLSAKYNGEKLIQLKRFYNPSTANIFSIEYTENKITVRQDYSNGISYQNISYADYFMDQNGNVSSIKLYVYDNNSPNNFTLYNEASYTYDNGNNPWKGVIYPTFLCQNLPNPMLFSQNNTLSETNNNTGTTNYYSYNYDENNLTTKGIDKYPYNVCSSAVTLDEYYTYTNCYGY
ncbi:hypothetical protein L3X39_04885 [Sabulilitoribacter multivorans]|uniref:YD repeat-containing protein n=1 Tax=Flaviramulus multivorans TaxID=1304750 RepID=A0ABS9IGV9_9FLAO|nr:hypothetical protein [Flaviramulus multivorans]MCF7559964.1 hypothetical protein [Flaviramulus multivorans]